MCLRPFNQDWSYFVDLFLLLYKKEVTCMKSIRTRLIVSFFTIIILCVGLATYNYLAVSSMNQQTEEVVSDELAVLLEINSLKYNISQSIGLARGYVLYGESSYRNDYDIYSVEFDLIERKLGPMEIEEIEGLLDKTKQWRETIQKDVFTLYDNGGTTLATNHLQTKVQPKAKDLMDRIEKLSNERERQMTTMGKQVVKYGQSSNMVGLVVTLAVF